MDKVQAHDEETQGSGSGSGFSDLSGLENETDDFGRRLLQHQRDAQRLNNALRGNQRAFRKARPKPRVAEQLEREEREEQDRLQRQAGVGQNHQRTGSGASSNGSDPPVTVPREWGRKARRQSDWLRKIYEPSENGEEETVNPDEDAIYQRTTAYTGDLDWSPTADRPMQTIETTPPPMRRQRQAPTPSTGMSHMNTTLHHITESGDDREDFTAASLLASTPAVSRLPRKIDELTRREIENVERRALTTRALDQIDERSPHGTASLRRSSTSSSKLRERAIADGLVTNAPQLSRPVTAPDKKAPSSPSRIPRRRRSLIGNKENLPLNGDMNGNAGLKGSETVGLVDRTAQAVNIKNALQQRPRHHRNDSMNLLKKLARVSSMSPSPARDMHSADSDSKDDREGRRKMLNLSAATAAAGPLSAESVNSDYTANTQPPKRKTEESHDREVNTKPLANHGIDDDYIDLKQEQAAEDVEQTPLPREAPSDAKTPVVTGAWVDTTMQAESQDPQQTTESAKAPAPDRPAASAAREPEADMVVDDDLRRTRSEPTNPKSALEAIVREARDQDGTQQFGDSTIQSLEDIVNPDLDPTDPTITFDFGVAADGLQQQENLDADRPLTQAEKDRRQERLAMEGMNKHLRTARTNIKDANRGLRRVENRIETVQGNRPPPEQNLNTNTNTQTVTVVTKASQGKHGKTDCLACGGGYQSVWYALWAEFRSCFYTWDPSNRYRIRFTWLGLACLLWWTWYLSETTLCSYYCHQFYAYEMVGFGVDPDAPRFPFVIPTLVFRPLRWLWKPVCEALAQGIGVVFHEFFGDRATSAEPPRMVRTTFRDPVRRVWESADAGRAREWVATATSVSSRVVESVVDAVDEAGSMWDDEFLS